MGLDKIILPIILKKLKGVMLMIVSKKFNKTYLNSEKNKKGGYLYRISAGISKLHNGSETFTREFLF